MNPRIVFLALVIAVCAGGGIFLGTRDIPAPRHSVEKVIANDHFFK